MTALAIFRRWGRPLTFGVLEQAISSATNFLFVVVLANLCGPRVFGEFSIAWSGLMLVEALLTSLFGDAVPALAHKLPASEWPRLRASLYALSAAAAGMIGAAVLAAAAAMCWLAPDYAAVTAATAVTIPAMRAQQMFRRLCYLDQRRGLAMWGAVVFALALASALGVLTVLGTKNGAAGMLCLACACILSGAMMLSRPQDFAWPNLRMIGWCARRVWRSGKWLLAAALSFWIGNTGLIPVAGALYGLEAGGALRVLQNLMMPLTQLTAVIYSMILPAAAQKLRKPDHTMILRMSFISVGMFSVLGLAYGAAITATGVRVVHLLFHGKFEGLTMLVIGIAALAAASDAIRAGVGVPLMAAGHTKGMFYSRMMSLAVLFGILPMTAVMGLSGLVTAMAVSNVAATGMLGIMLLKFVSNLKDRS